MEDNDLVLGAVAKLSWVGDRALLADIKPRHIGRVVSFNYEPETAKVPVVYEPTDVMGTLEGREGSTLIVTGKDYDYHAMRDFRIWRKVIDK